jgi:rhodanese-related sulfurtransferase
MTNLMKNQGIINNGIRSVTPRETFELLKKGAILIDLREYDFSDFKSFDAANVILLPISEFDMRMSDLSKDKTLILADSTGLNSRDKVKILLQIGFTSVASLAGGFVEWERDGLPVKTDVNQRLSGSCACQLKPREKMGLRG